MIAPEKATELTKDHYRFLVTVRPDAPQTLTVVELRCMLSRRRRDREISGKVERGAFELFQADVREGFLTVLPMNDVHFAAASDILEKLPQVPLQTLDALHLAVAASNRARMIATADTVMATAAKALKFDTQLFH